MRILAIESSARTASVAIAEENKLLSEIYCNTGLTHSLTLMPMVNFAFSSAALKLSDIDLLCVSTGPGSFTGIRIGIAAVKGISQSTHIKCFGASTLETIAANLIFKNCIICSVMDARCDQVYTATFESNNGIISRLTEDKAMMISCLKTNLASIHSDLPIILAGDGAEMCYNILRDDVDNLDLAPERIRFQRASGLTTIAFQNFDCNNVLTASELLPKYLRVPQAERELRKRRGDLE